MHSQEPFISGPEAAKLLGYSAEHVRRLCVSGKIKAQKVGKAWLISQEELQKFTVQAATEAPTLAEATSASFSYLPTSSKFASILIGLVVGVPATAALVLAVPDGIASLKTQYQEVSAAMQEVVSQNTGDYFRNLFTLGEIEHKSGIVLGEQKNIITPSAPRNGIPNSTFDIPHSPAVLGISNDEVIAAMRAVLAEGLPQDILVQLKGEKGDPGPGNPIAYTLPTSTNQSSMGSIAGFTHLSGNDLTTQTLNVTQNATFNTITVAGCTGCAPTWNSITNPSSNLSLTMAANTTTFTYNAATGSNNLFNLTDTNNNTGTGYLLNLTTGTGSTLKPLHILAGGVEALTILANGNVGIGTNSPTSKLDVTTSALGITQTTSSGLALVNLTAAAAGAQQISPAIRWSGSGWKTDATAASQSVDFRSYVVPVQGTANPTGYLSFGSSVNGAAYNDGQLVLTSAGNVGIGTTNPGSILDIVGTFNSAMTQQVITATGGTITTNGGYTIHTFTTSGTFTPSGTGTVEYLVLGGGGGGGGGNVGAGGGAGGFRTGTLPVTAGAMTVTVGAGGVGEVGGTCSASGENSVFGSITSLGGGRGGGGCNGLGGVGGSGGGGAQGANGLTGTMGQGYDGGNSIASPDMTSGGGGGGGAVGGLGTGTAPGVGGAGRASSISGSSVTYAGGGGGTRNSGGTTFSGGAGGSGGGGAGASTNGGTGTAGTANTGGGGGGGPGSGASGKGGAGGSGIVIVRYLTSTPILINSININSIGNIGAGNTTPLSKLGITGNLSIGATYGVLAAPISGLIVEGNVGIGNSAPETNVEIGDGALNTSFLGSSRILSVSDNLGGSRLYLSGLTQSDIILEDSGAAANDKVIQIVNNDQELTFRTLGNAGGLESNIFFLDNTGDVSVPNGAFCVDNDSTNCPSSPTAGRLYSINATVLTDDLAEYMRSSQRLEPGDIVAVDPDFENTTERTHDQERRNQELGVEKGLDEVGVKKAVAVGTPVIGIVSTKPGITLGGFEPTENDYEVALAGRVPVKISEENGSVVIGDRLTISATVPGYAMKMTESGNSIGIALENSAPDKDKILVFVNLGYQKLEVAQNSSGELITAEGDYDLNGFKLLNVKAITSISGKWSISEDGILIATKVKAKVIETEQGVTIKDKTNGLFYCVYFDNGAMLNKPGACDSVDSGQVAGESTPPPAPEPAPEPQPEPTPEPSPTPEPTP